MTIFRHRVIGRTAGGEQWVSTLHSNSGVAVAAAEAAWAGFVESVCGAVMTRRWGTQQYLDESVTDELSPLNGKTVRQARTSHTIQGSSVLAPLSPRDTLVISLLTISSLRQDHGRMSWPAPTSEYASQSGGLMAGERGVIAGAFQTAFNGMLGTTLPVIFHKATLTYTPVTRLRVGETFGSQRRRTNKTPNPFVEMPI